MKDMIRDTLLFGLKLGTAGAVVYVTIDNGIWGSSEEASSLYNKIYYHLQLLRREECEEETTVGKIAQSIGAVIL
jgi:hypothetical protein